MASHQCHLWRTRHPRREPTSLALRPAQAGGGHRGYVDLKTRHRRRDLLASALVCADASRSIQPGLHRCPVGSRWVASPHAADQVRCRFGPNGCSQQDKTSASPNRSVTPSTQGTTPSHLTAAMEQFCPGRLSCSSYPHRIRRVRCATQTREYPTAGQAAAASGMGLDAREGPVVKRLGR
jgi:hypothetical protein